jgi:hypothetical protein
MDAGSCPVALRLAAQMPVSAVMNNRFRPGPPKVKLTAPGGQISPGLDNGSSGLAGRIEVGDPSRLLPGPFADQQSAVAVHGHTVGHVRSRPYDCDRLAADGKPIAAQLEALDRHLREPRSDPVHGPRQAREVESVFIPHIHRPFVCVAICHQLQTGGVSEQVLELAIVLYE